MVGFEDGKITETFNQLQILLKYSTGLFSQCSMFRGKKQNIVKFFSIHSGIIKTKQKLQLNKKFSFQCVSEATIKKVVKNLPRVEGTTGEINVIFLEEVPVNAIFLEEVFI